MDVITSEAVAAAAAAIRRRTRMRPEIGLILGSGLGGLAAAISPEAVIPHAEIPGFPRATAPGHAGRLVVGTLCERRVVALEGRFHLYEGWSAAHIGFVVHVLARLGAKALVVTNAAGALNAEFAPGEVMLITDHLNMTGANPLVGAVDETLGPRFPDLSRVYDGALGDAMRRAAAETGERLREGIYAGVLGPSLETSAERRFLRLAGGDAVGMSTVTEVIAAVHAGLRVVALSAISNAATGGPDQAPDTIDEVLANAAVAGASIERMLRRFLPGLAL